MWKESVGGQEIIWNKHLIWTKADRGRYQPELRWWEEFAGGLVSPKRLHERFTTEGRKKLFPELLLWYIKRVHKRNGQVSLLDVGSGPFSPLAWGVDEGLFDITAIDPLANEYRELMWSHGYEYSVVPIKGCAEDLAEQFPEKRFDIVYCRNALDHTASPQDSMRNMCEVLKREGYLFLEGSVREGTKQNWGGLHKHDLVPQCGRLFHYDKEGKATDLTTGNRLICVYQGMGQYKSQICTDFAVGDWFVVVYRRPEGDKIRYEI